MAKVQKATLADVAAEADVSAITVSRALRKPDIVSQALHARIDAAIQKLGYVPDLAARALASGRTDVIGLMAPLTTEPAYTDILRGIMASIAPTPHVIQLIDPSQAGEGTALRTFLGSKPAGLIVAGIDQVGTTRDLLANAPCPVVQVMEIAEDPIDMMIGLSLQEAAQGAAHYLHEQGYRKPGFMAARMTPAANRQLRGFRLATEVTGTFSEARVMASEGHPAVTLGAKLLADLLTQAPELDAVFCTDDALALGALFEARRQGIDVPAALGICGFHDTEAAASAELALTSIRTRRYEMGTDAVEMVLDRLAGAPKGRKVIDLGFEIVPRASTAKPA